MLPPWAPFPHPQHSPPWQPQGKKGLTSSVEPIKEDLKRTFARLGELRCDQRHKDPEEDFTVSGGKGAPLGLLG